MQIWMPAARSLIVVGRAGRAVRDPSGLYPTGSITAKVGVGIWMAGRRTASSLRSPLMVLIGLGIVPAFQAVHELGRRLKVHPRHTKWAAPPGAIPHIVTGTCYLGRRIHAVAPLGSPT